MSEKSSSGSTPCVYRFSASVTRSTLPVRSPLPKRQPSTRSAPAIMRELGGGDAAAAVVVRVHGQHDGVAPREVAAHPLDLVGVDVGRRDLDGRGQVDDHLVLRASAARPSITASQISFAKSSSVPVKLSGEYWNVHSVAGCCAASSPHQRRAVDGDRDDARAILAEHDAPLRGRRRVVEVDDRAPRAASDSNVRPISSSRACVSTWIVTSSGIRSLLDQPADEVEARSARPPESRPRFP